MSVRPRTVRGVLLAAARLIERKGWCQGSYKKSGRHCAIGAIGEVMEWRREGLQARALDKLTTVIGEISVAAWNDRPGRRRPEVIAALRRAATAR